MSIAFASSFTLIGVRVGGVSEKNRPIVGCTVSLCAPGDHVEQQDEVGAGIERPRVVGRLHHRHLARRPAVHVLHLVVVHRRETGARFGAIERARHARRIDARRPRGAAPAGDRRGTRRRARSASGDRHRERRSCGTRRPCRAAACTGSGSVSTRSGVPSCQPPGNVGGFGASAGFPFGRALLDPLRDERDLIVAEPPFVGELAVSGLGQPRRHRARCVASAISRARDAALVVEHAERRTGHADRIADPLALGPSPGQPDDGRSRSSRRGSARCPC